MSVKCRCLLANRRACSSLELLRLWAGWLVRKRIRDIAVFGPSINKIQLVLLLVLWYNEARDEASVAASVTSK